MSTQIAYSNNSGAVDTISAETTVITKPGGRIVKNLMITNTSTNLGWFNFDGSNNWILLPAAASGPYTLYMRNIKMTGNLVVKPNGGNPTVHATVW
jgi:hypothetical protein